MELWPTIRAYGRERFSAMARKVIYSLQRMPATGIYGDGDYDYRTVWDEYCHEIQYGPHGILDWAWNSVIDPETKHVIEKIPPTERPLLELAIGYWLFEPNQEDDLMAGKSIDVPVGDEELQEAVVEVVKEMAIRRNLERFELF